MGHKGPVLRPKCIGPGRPRTHILYYYILLLFYVLFLRKILPTVEFSCESIIINVATFKTNPLSASQGRWQWRQEVPKVCQKILVAICERVTLCERVKCWTTLVCFKDGVVRVHSMNTYGKAEVLLHSFLTSVINGVWWSVWRPGRLTLGIETSDTRKMFWEKQWCIQWRCYFTENFYRYVSNLTCWSKSKCTVLKCLATTRCSRQSLLPGEYSRNWNISWYIRTEYGQNI
jgi:hypothetical protein